MRALEEYRSSVASVAEMAGRSQWLLGDIFCEAVKEYDRAVLSDLAALCHRTVAWARQVARVAAAFPEEYRYPDKPWSIYRAVLQAARRLDREPLEVLREVVDGEMSEADIARLGRPDAPEKAHLLRRCEWCGSRVTVEADGGLAGTVVSCPVCLSDGREVTLGALVARGGCKHVNMVARRGRAWYGEARRGWAGRGMARHGRASTVATKTKGER